MKGDGQHLGHSQMMACGNPEGNFHALDLVLS